MDKLLIRNPKPDALENRHISHWRTEWKGPLAVYSRLTLLPDGSITNKHRLQKESQVENHVASYALPWLGATGFIEQNYDEITVLSVPEFRRIRPVSGLSRSVRHLDKKPLPSSESERLVLRRRFGPGAVGETAYDLLLKTYDHDFLDVPMLGIDKQTVRGALYALQASGLVETFARPDQFICAPWHLSKEEARESVDAWLQSPEARRLGIEERWQNFRKAYKSMARHFGLDSHDHPDDASRGLKLMAEHEGNEIRVYLLAAAYLTHWMDYKEQFANTIRYSGHSFKTFCLHIDAIAADYAVKQHELYGGNPNWPFGVLKSEGFDYMTEFKDW